MAKAGHGVELEKLEVEALIELRDDLMTELRSRHTRLKEEAERQVKSLEAALGIEVKSGGGGRTAGGRRTRATQQEVEARKSAVLSALKGTGKGKGKSKAEIATAVGLEPLAVQQTLQKLKGDGEIKMEGQRANATWFVKA